MYIIFIKIKTKWKKLTRIITSCPPDAGSKPVGVQDVIPITKVIVDHVTGTPIKACTENLIIGAGSMVELIGINYYA